MRRFGSVVAVTLLAGLALVGASFAFPWGSTAAYALLVPGRGRWWYRLAGLAGLVPAAGSIFGRLCAGC